MRGFVESIAYASQLEMLEVSLSSDGMECAIQMKALEDFLPESEASPLISISGVENLLDDYEAIERIMQMQLRLMSANVTAITFAVADAATVPLEVAPAFSETIDCSLPRDAWLAGEAIRLALRPVGFERAQG
jgi:hypothetical protein